ncbi:MAG: insulinase family protein [Treponema sp.]|nr:insulinase family protein [Treponema sp.]
MKQVKKFMVVFATIVLSSMLTLAAKETPIDDLYEYKLDNGLSLFVAENHSVPLVYIEIAVKAGATTQTPETAGLFHLYEHMMFKGNELYTNSAAVQRAVKDMGVSKWNAYTEIDCVHYYFTLPSDQLENGMAFWNAAIRAPLMNEQELENEKKVVLSEIQGDVKGNFDFLSNYVEKTLFPDAPYRLDPAGAVSVVRNATVAQMRDMQSKYYIPANSALFIGGDVTPDEVFDMTQKIFGSWSNNGNSAPELPVQPSLNPLEQRQKSAFVFDSKSYAAELSIIFRGPDLSFNEKDSYIAAYLAALLNEDSEDFKQAMLSQKRYQFANAGAIDVSYAARGSGSLFSISCQTEITDDFMFDEIIKKQIPAVVSKKYAFSPEKKELIINKMQASRLKNTQSAEGLLSSLRSFWARSSSADYYYNYYDNIRNITREDAVEWVKKYITEANPLIVYVTSDGTYQTVLAERYASGLSIKDYTIEKWLSSYDIIKEKDSKLWKEKQTKWWKDKKFAPDAAKIAKETAVPQKTKIYVPTQDLAASKKYMVWEPPKYETRNLKNGIPVYFLYDENKRVNYIHIGVRGGPTYLKSSKYSGLEESLFEGMCVMSRVYNQESWRKILAETRSSVYANTYTEGSVLSLGTTDIFLSKTLPLFLDGFMHPNFQVGTYIGKANCVDKDVTPMKSEPFAFLEDKILTCVTTNHPYAKRRTLTEESMNAMWTKGDFTQLYDDIVRPQNIFVVATGNVNADNLMKELEKTLGTIQSKSSKTSKDKRANKKKNRNNEALQAEIAGIVPPYVVSGEDEVFTLESVASGSGHAAYAVSAPAENDDDYLPMLLAADMYNDTLFNVVREHYGVCYTPSAYISGGKASLGMVQLYKMSDVEHFASRVKEARDYLAQGKLIDSTDKSGKFEFSTVDKRLQSYKNAQIIATYSPQATVQGMGASMVYNLLTYNEPFRTRKTVSQIHDATASQVVDVFKKYWVDAPGKWFVVVNENDEDRVSFE